MHITSVVNHADIDHVSGRYIQEICGYILPKKPHDCEEFPRRHLLLSNNTHELYKNVMPTMSLVEVVITT